MAVTNPDWSWKASEASLAVLKAATSDQRLKVARVARRVAIRLNLTMGDPDDHSHDFMYYGHVAVLFQPEDEELTEPPLWFTGISHGNPMNRTRHELYTKAAHILGGASAPRRFAYRTIICLI